MPKTSSLLSSLAFVCVASATTLGPMPAAAQSSYGGGRPSAYMTTDHRLRATQLLGKQVFNDKGEAIGRVGEVLVDTNVGPTTVVLSVGKYLGSGAKMVATPLDHLNLEGNHPMMAGADQMMLKSLPAFTYTPMIEHGSAG